MPSNETSKMELTIAHIDYDPEVGPIIFVSFPGLYRYEASNLFYPFSEDAVNRSVVTLVSSNVTFDQQYIADFNIAYPLLRRHMLAGKINEAVLKITAADVLEARRKGN
jgi:hypothetical protein